MLLGSLLKLNIPGLDIDQNLIERVKLLDVHISNNLSWNLHVDYICARANRPTRLHYLKRLKRPVLPADRLVHWCNNIIVIRPVLEYCAIVWLHGLLKYQTESIEVIQRRALRIVHPITASMPYWVALDYAGLPPLSDRRDKLCQISSRKCMIHPDASTISCHQPVTPTSSPGSEEHPSETSQSNQLLQIIRNE